MSLGITYRKTRRALGVGFALSLGLTAVPAVAQSPTLSEEAFEEPKRKTADQKQMQAWHATERKGSVHHMQTLESSSPNLRRKCAVERMI